MNRVARFILSSHSALASSPVIYVYLLLLLLALSVPAGKHSSLLPVRREQFLGCSSWLYTPYSMQVAPSRGRAALETPTTGNIILFGQSPCLWWRRRELLSSCWVSDTQTSNLTLDKITLYIKKVFNWQVQSPFRYISWLYQYQIVDRIVCWLST